MRIVLNAFGSVPGHSKGKTTKVTSSVSESRNISFDQMGRLTASQQITDGTTYPFEYAYNLSGALIEQTYPSTRKVKFTLNADGELAQVESKKNSSSGYWKYADSFSYNAAGAFTKMQLGNGRWETATYNDRQQVTMIGLGSTDSTQNLLRLDLEYGRLNLGTGQVDANTNNGALAKQKITIPAAGTQNAATFQQYYSYDSLNRIERTTENLENPGQSIQLNWRQWFTYDRYGNRRFDTSTGATTTIPGECSAAVCNPDINTSDNRLSPSQGYDYDENGALVEDAIGQRFGYDAESHQTKYFSASNTTEDPDATYHYDGEGRRVKKVVGTEVTIFVHDAAGQLAAEYTTATVPSVEEAKVSYLTTDHLGSPRIITDANGAVISRNDFTAFGENVTSSQRVGGEDGNGYDPPNVRQDYTGYQKDEESGLEFAQARYYNTGHGRFTSVDPLTASATIRNPQTFNRYSYVLNSPYKFVDPLGLMAGRPNPDSGIVLVGGGDWFTSCYCGATPQFTRSAPEQIHQQQQTTSSKPTQPQAEEPNTPPHPTAEANAGTQAQAQPTTITATGTALAVHPSCMNARRCAATEEVPISVSITVESVSVSGSRTGSATAEANLTVSVTGANGPVEGSVMESVTSTENFGAGPLPSGTVTNPGSVSLVNGQFGDDVTTRPYNSGRGAGASANALETSQPVRVDQTATFTITPANPYVAASFTVTHTRSLGNFSGSTFQAFNPRSGGTIFRLSTAALTISRR